MPIAADDGLVSYQLDFLYVYYAHCTERPWIVSLVHIGAEIVKSEHNNNVMYLNSGTTMYGYSISH